MKVLWLWLKQYWVLVIILSTVTFAVFMDIKHNSFSLFTHHHGASNYGSIDHED